MDKMTAIKNVLSPNSETVIKMSAAVKAVNIFAINHGNCLFWRPVAIPFQIESLDYHDFYFLLFRKTVFF
jgi:hypothetical protein